MNVTPLVDVVLVLLIIFMIIPAAQDALNIEVPAVVNPDEERAEGEDAPEPLMVEISKDGRVHFEERPVADGALEGLLDAAHRREPRRRLVLRADRDTEYAIVRPLFATVQSIGFPGVSLRVNHEDRGDGAPPAGAVAQR